MLINVCRILYCMTLPTFYIYIFETRDFIFD
uniref:Uncharacterized protein n=1 Tax=Arundo donax TaxID=35708 RepID=A0A0A8YVM5_ARUDO